MTRTVWWHHILFFLQFMRAPSTVHKILHN